MTSRRRLGLAPSPSQTAYELRSVAAPFGYCIEPSNVKAGGGACPIRFQCSGCGFYRADPFFIPAIQDHFQAVRADREVATAMGVDDFVLRTSPTRSPPYQNVLDSMQTTLAGYDDDQGAEVEQAGRDAPQSAGRDRPQPAANNPHRIPEQLMTGSAPLPDIAAPSTEAARTAAENRAHALCESRRRDGPCQT